MTVNKNSTTTKTKKKSSVSNAASSSSSTTVASTSSTSKTTKTSKVVGTSSTKTEVAGTVSKSSSASSLQISDVSHLPVNAHVVTYTVTESLPTGSGEKITTYKDTGATSTEYRHFVAQDSSSNIDHSTTIQQISSTLNESTSNLSQASGSTYTVTEPLEELKLTYNKNDSGWNGKFIMEQPTSKKGKNQLIKKDGGTIVEESSTSSSHQSSSSVQKSSSSSYVIEIVDGKERIVDQKHHESGHATSSSNDEFLSTRSGTNITPEVHYKQKAKDSSTKYDTAVPELQQPKSQSSEAVREIHQVGDQHSSTAYITHDKNALDHNTSKRITDKTNKRDTTVHFLDSERTDTDIRNINKSKHTKTDSSNFYGEDVSSKTQHSSNTAATSKTSKDLGSTSTITTTTTYYDSKGNVIKTLTDVDAQNIPGSSSTVTYRDQTNKSDYIDKRKTHLISDSTDFKGSSETVIIDDSKIFHDKSQKLTDETRRTQTSDSKNFYGSDEHVIDSTTKTYYVDENYVDTQKIRNSQTTTDSKNFYGHGVDSKNTMVSNVYDTKAVQNTIGTKGTVIRDSTIDSTDIIYSNDRNYGKTGWNGQFTYEKPAAGKPSVQPQTPSKTTPAAGKPTNQPRTPSSTTPAAGKPTNQPESMPAAGKPSQPRKSTSPTRKPQQPGYKGSSPSGRAPSPARSDVTSSTFTVQTDRPPSPARSDVTSSTYTIPSKRGPSPSGSDVSSTTYYVDENYVDTSKIRNAQTTTDSRNFYGHSTDSKGTVVKNVYDTKAVQNTISSKGTILKDDIIESKDVIYSYDRNYGKTGWNGEFTYETPIKPNKQEPSKTPKRADSPSKSSPGKPARQDSPSRKTSGPDSPTKKGPKSESPSKKSERPESPSRTGRKPTQNVQEFLLTEINENITQTMDGYPKRPQSPTRKTTGPLDKSHPSRPLDKTGRDVSTFEATSLTENVSSTTDSKTSVFKGSTTYEDNVITETITILDSSGKPISTETRVVREPSKPSDVTTSEVFRSDIRDSKSNIMKDSKTIIDETIIVDGRSGPRPRQPTDKYPVTDSRTVVETFESVTNLKDSKTSVTKDSQTFVDNQSSVEHYTVTDSYDSAKPKGPKDGKYPISDRPKGLDDKGPRKLGESPERRGPKGPKGPDDQEPKRGPRGPGDKEPYTSPDRRGPKGPDDKEPSRPDRRGPRGPDDKEPDWPDRKGPRGPDDKEPHCPDRRGPKGPDDKEPHWPDRKGPKGPNDKYPVTDSRTVIESYESVTNLSDSKTTVIKDSQTFVDNQKSVEHYTITDSYDSAKPKGPKDLKQPIEDWPNRRGPDDRKSGPKRPDDKTPRDGKGPRGLDDKAPDDRKGPKGPDGKEPKRPGDKEPKRPGDKEPRRPGDKGPRDVTTVDNYEINESFTDVKTSVIKDSKTFVDEKTVVDNYYITDVKDVTDIRDVKDTTVNKFTDIRNVDVVDRYDKTVINENILDVKEIVSDLV